MTLIEKPVAGQPMRAGWGASVAERLNQIGSVGAPGQLVREGLFGQGVAPPPKNQRDRRGTPAAPQPYEVRWAQSVNDGAGNWIIWLPTGQELIVGGTVVDLTAALSAAGDPYPSGWYELADLDLSQGGDIWLNVTIPAVGEPSAEFADQPGDGSSAAAGDKVVPIIVATIEVDSTTGAKRAYQNLVGALVVSGGAQVTGEAVTNGCFSLITAETPSETPGEEPTLTAHFVNRYFNFGNLTLESADLELSTGGVFVALKVSTNLDQSHPTATIESYPALAALQADQHSLDYVVIPLYHLDEDFSILCDFRVAPVAPVGEVL